MEVSATILLIVGTAIGLLLFGFMAPDVSRNLLVNNYTCTCAGDGTACKGACDKTNASSNTTAGLVAPLVTIVFIAGMIIMVLRGVITKH